MELAGVGRMPSDPVLAPIVGSTAPLGQLRRRLALAAGFGIGVASVAGVIHATFLLHGASPVPVAPPAAPVAAPAPAITIAPPIVISIERTIAPPAPLSSGAELGCPVLTRADVPIGRTVDPRTIMTDAPTTASVAAAAGAPQLAVVHDGTVWVSDDDGRSFDRAFEGHPVTQVVIDRDGTIYALAASELGVRAPDGRTRWRPLASCATDDRCERSIGLIGPPERSQIVSIVDEHIATSRNQGRSWTPVVDPAFAWSTHGGKTFSWRGDLYSMAHYVDMCGVDDLSTFRLDAGRRVAHDVFHNYYTQDEPVLTPSSDVDPVWTWREQCWSSEPDVLGRCTNKSAVRSALLAAAYLIPAEGARTLAVYGGGVIELCGAGARQIYRAFPFARIDAVDAVGRALVMQDMTLLRWSPVHGWRALRTFVDPTPP